VGQALEEFTRGGNEMNKANAQFNINGRVRFFIKLLLVFVVTLVPTIAVVGSGFSQAEAAEDESGIATTLKLANLVSPNGVEGTLVARAASKGSEWVEQAQQVSLAAGEAFEAEIAFEGVEAPLVWNVTFITVGSETVIDLSGGVTDPGQDLEYSQDSLVFPDKANTHLQSIDPAKPVLSVRFPGAIVSLQISGDSDSYEAPFTIHAVLGSRAQVVTVTPVDGRFGPIMLDPIVSAQIGDKVPFSIDILGGDARLAQMNGHHDFSAGNTWAEMNFDPNGPITLFEISTKEDTTEIEAAYPNPQVFIAAITDAPAWSSGIVVAFRPVNNDSRSTDVGSTSNTTEFGWIRLTTVSEDGLPVVGVRASLIDGATGATAETRVSDENGVVFFEALPADEYIVSLEKREYDDLALTYTVSKNNAVTESITLETSKIFDVIGVVQIVLFIVLGVVFVLGAAIVILNITRGWSGLRPVGRASYQ